jgi:hypothetical protein
MEGTADAGGRVRYMDLEALLMSDCTALETFSDLWPMSPLGPGCVKSRFITHYAAIPHIIAHFRSGPLTGCSWR